MATFPKYLSVKEVAAILGVVKLSTVYSMIKKNEIPGHVKLGSMHLFDEEELYNGLKELARKKAASKRLRGHTDNRHNL